MIGTTATTPAATPGPTPAAPPAAQGLGTGRQAREELPPTRTPETHTALAGGRRRGATPSLMGGDRPEPRISSSFNLVL